MCDVCGAEPVMGPGFTVCELCAAAQNGTGRHLPAPENRPSTYAALWADPENYYDDEEDE